MEAWKTATAGGATGQEQEVNNVGWRIDYFYVSDDLKDKIVDADILDHVMGSDHCPVKLVIEI